MSFNVRVNCDITSQFPRIESEPMRASEDAVGTVKMFHVRDIVEIVL